MWNSLPEEHFTSYSVEEIHLINNNVDILIILNFTIVTCTWDISTLNMCAHLKHENSISNIEFSSKFKKGNTGKKKMENGIKILTTIFIQLKTKVWVFNLAGEIKSFYLLLLCSGFQVFGTKIIIGWYQGSYTTAGYSCTYSWIQGYLVHWRKVTKVFLLLDLYNIKSLVT